LPQTKQLADLLDNLLPDDADTARQTAGGRGRTFPRRSEGPLRLDRGPSRPGRPPTRAPPARDATSASVRDL
jgi:hypothetical protein